MNAKVRVLIAILAALLLALFAVARAKAAPPDPPTVWTCPSAKAGDNAPACAAKPTCAIPKLANDMVRTTLDIQRWEPYSTLTAGSPVAPCSGGWSTMQLVGIPLFSSLTPPVVTPPLPPPPALPIPPADIWVALQWTCQIVHKVATCTAPITGGSP